MQLKSFAIQQKSCSGQQKFCTKLIANIIIFISLILYNKIYEKSYVINVRGFGGQS